MLLSETLRKHYRPCMGIMLFNRKGQVFLGRRVSGFDKLDPETFVDSYRWQMPQGGIDKGELPEAAASRELKEETGISSAELLVLTPGWLAYDFPPEYKKRKWRGQRQKWALMLFTGNDSEIDLEADDHQEFDAWQWADLDDVLQLIVPFKRGVYEEIIQTARPLRDYIIRSGQ